jgi:FKBP-type peptidyl-prolyl cis-trans isomerase 2
MALNKGDFIEIEFTGKVKNGEIFDSNIKENLEKLHAGHDHPIESKPFIFCLGQGMFLKSIDDFLIDKNIGEYTIELQPENAFGKRNSEKIKRVPLQIFRKQKMNPIPGMTFNFDGIVGKVMAVSGGRVLIDFNNLLAGKEIVYEIKILRKIDNLNEKIKAFNDFIFRKDIKFEIKDKKLIIEADKQFTQFAELFKEKYKDIFDLDLEVKEVHEKPKEKKEK